MSDRKRTQPEETESAVVEEPEAASVGAEEEAVPEVAEQAVEEPAFPKGEVENGDAMLVDAAAFIKEDAHVKPGDGETAVVYRGLADAFEHDGRVFRPDQPVIVPSDVAEELLTYPNEQFDQVEE